MQGRGAPDITLAPMCGIVGYVGSTVDGKAQNVVMEGLARLEYRGYDSAGIALVTESGIESEKRAGKLENLRGALESHPLDASRTGIGHTAVARATASPSSTTGSSRTSTP
jgi:glucosamine 6-phosphate synthetase-like amidotransferase/phosphosugar isomerase protein